MTKYGVQDDRLLSLTAIMDILVDGYNVIMNSNLLHAAGGKRELAREALIAQLAQRYRHTPHRVIVVFDGKGEWETVTYEKRIRVVYSRHGETADSVIARLAAEARSAGREVEMYSNDREVQRSVVEQGGGARAVSHLANQLNAPSRDVAKRAQHRIIVRRKYGLDPNYNPDDEPQTKNRKGKKRK